jgi:hypothetical protein
MFQQDVEFTPRANFYVAESGQIFEQGFGVHEIGRAHV